MTLVSSILTDAFRELNILAAGKSPSSTQEEEALRLYNAIVTSLFSSDAGEILRPWPLGNYGRQSVDQLDLTATQFANPPINSRLMHTAEAAITVYLPPAPSDGSRVAISDPYSRLSSYNVTLDGNGHTIETAASLVLSTDALQRTWFYRAELGDWKRISALVAADTNPFPEDFDMMFIVLLALRLSPRYGRPVSEASATMMQKQRRDFLARYVQSEDLRINEDLANNSVQTYAQGWDTSTDQFNRGR